MKSQRELSIIGACGGYSKTSAKHAPVVGNSVLNLLINIWGSGSGHFNSHLAFLAPQISALRKTGKTHQTPGLFLLCMLRRYSP